MEPGDDAPQAPEGKITDTGSRLRKHVCLSVALVAVLVALAIGYVGVVNARERTRRRICCSNLRSLIYGVVLYAGDNQERLPPDFSAFIGSYVSSRGLFLCPSEGKATALDRDQFKPGDTLDGHTDYVYVSGLMENDPPNYITFFDDEWNHAGDGVCVARVGGQAEWLSDFKALYDQLALQEKELAAQGRKMTIIRPPWSKRLPSFEAAP